jgi:hypothetical protein
MARVTAISRSPRTTGVRSDQAGKAPTAESTARATSAEREHATRHISFPLAGHVLEKDPPAEGSDSNPSIQFGMISGMSGWFMAQTRVLAFLLDPRKK